MSQITQRDRIIILMGPTGSGKSTFVECATRQDGRTVGHSLRSCTADIRTVRTTHPEDGQPVLFVDTPGFDDTFKSDVDILTTIADWLVKVYQENVDLATILYLHKITDNRMTGSLLKNLQMFVSVCGLKAMPNVVITTTMWGKVDRAEGEEREYELKGDFWKEMLDHGCKIERFYKTYQSAWDVIGSLPGLDQGTTPHLPQEIVDDRLRLNETEAGVHLNKELERLIRDQKDAAHKLALQAKKKKSNPLVVQQLNEQTAEIEVKIRQTTEQLRAMKIPITRKFYNRIRSLF